MVINFHFVRSVELNNHFKVLITSDMTSVNFFSAQINWDSPQSFLDGLNWLHQLLPWLV